MEIVGYDKNENFTGFLKEATITCTMKELDKIADFILNVKKIIYEEPNWECCKHFKDFVKDWNNTFSDLIILKIEE